MQNYHFSVTTTTDTKVFIIKVKAESADEALVQAEKLFGVHRDEDGNIMSQAAAVKPISSDKYRSFKNNLKLGIIKE